MGVAVFIDRLTCRSGVKHLGVFRPNFGIRIDAEGRLVRGSLSISGRAVGKRGDFGQALSLFGFHRRTRTGAERLQLRLGDGIRHHRDRGTGQRRGECGPLRRDTLPLIIRARLGRRRQKRRVRLEAEAATDDAAKRRAKTISTEAVEKEVGAERDVEEQVTHRLRYLCAQSLCTIHFERLS